MTSRTRKLTVGAVVGFVIVALVLLLKNAAEPLGVSFVRYNDGDVVLRFTNSSRAEIHFGIPDWPAMPGGALLGSHDATEMPIDLSMVIHSKDRRMIRVSYARPKSPVVAFVLKKLGVRAMSKTYAHSYVHYSKRGM